MDGPRQHWTWLNIFDETVGRIGRSIGGLMKVSKQCDQQNGVPPVTEMHLKCSAAKDLERLLKQLNKDSQVFESRKGRRHKHFKKFKMNIACKLNSAELKQWMNEKIHKIVELQ